MEYLFLSLPAAEKTISGAMEGKECTDSGRAGKQSSEVREVRQGNERAKKRNLWMSLLFLSLDLESLWVFRWSTVDVDTLLAELDAKDRELERLQNSEYKFNRSNEIMEHKRDKVLGLNSVSLR